MPSWRELGGPARQVAAAVTAAVQAAASAEPTAFEAAAGALAALPAEQAGLVLGAVVRELLEDQHPDGLDGDDIRVVLARCYRGAVGWLPPVRVRIEPLVAVLSSALGIHEPGVTYVDVIGPPPPPVRSERADEWADPDVGAAGAGQVTSATTAVDVVAPVPPTTAEYAWHASLLIDDLLRASGRSLDRYLDAAFAEIAREQAQEMP